MKKAIFIISWLCLGWNISMQGQSPADSAYIKGAACEQMQQYRKAYHYYSEWLQSDSLNTKALNAAARTALLLGRVSEAESLYVKSLHLDSSNYYAGLQLAKLYFQRKDYLESLNYYEWLLERDSTNISFLQGAGDCISNLGSYPTALNYYNAAVNLNKENAALAITLINTHLRIHKEQPEPPLMLSMAMEVCDTALVYNPAHSDLEQAKGVIYFLGGDYHAADSVLSRLIAIGDSSEFNLRYVGFAKYRQKNYLGAIPYLDKLYQLDTTNVEIIMSLGTCHSVIYNGKKALQLFDKAEKLMYPTDEEKYNLSLMRADTYRGNGDRLNAQKYYWEASKLSKKNRQAMLSRLVSFRFDREDFEAFSKEEYERELLYLVLYMRELIGRKTLTDIQQKTLDYATSVMSLYIEDMFFKDIEKTQMRAPDGEIFWVTVEELTRLVQIKNN
ncbi:MAG: tetratricopeptide repeat protein [Bacteroidales bacterium]|nr:tetratricopeptide repeat protein [Bacteroidales bacterium]